MNLYFHMSPNYCPVCFKEILKKNPQEAEDNQIILKSKGGERAVEEDNLENIYKYCNFESHEIGKDNGNLNLLFYGYHSQARY